MPPDDRAPPAVAGDPDPTVVAQHADQASQDGPPSASPDPDRPAGRDGAGESGRDRAAAADPVAWLIALATFAVYDLLSIFKYLRLAPGSWDLGIFTEYDKQIAHLHAPVVAI